MDAETEEVLNEFSFLGSDSEDAAHELRMQTDTTDWGKDGAAKKSQVSSTVASFSRLS